MREHEHTTIARRVAGVLLGAAFVSALQGCTHNYYYGAGACAPTGVAPTVEYGSVCDVPTQVIGGGPVIVGPPLRTGPLLSGARPPRVVVSQPRGSSRLGWRIADPDGGLATTRIDGAVDDPTLTR